MALAAPRYAPDFRVQINGQPVPASLRASISGVSHQTGLEGADRVELTLVNENLRWLDHPLLALDNELALSIGYAPAPLEQVFVGDIVGQSATFPGGGAPTLAVVAHDRRQRLQQGTKDRWFAIPLGCLGNYPIPDLAVASLVSIENLLIPVFDPVTASLALLLGGAEVVVARGKPDALQKLIRKQVGESDYDFLRRLGRENGWEMVIDHSGPLGGHQLRFTSLASHLTPDVTLKYGRSLIDFSPHLSSVGQVAAVQASFWVSEIKTEFTVTVSWDWDRNALDLGIAPNVGAPIAPAKQTTKAGNKGAIVLLGKPINYFTAPRVILSELLPRLNERLTGSGTTVGDPRIQAGTVARLENLGERLGGLYRVTAATHTIDGGGYRTRFEARKEIWFGSIPLVEQGAVRVNFQGQTVRGG
jgi:phage protein D